MRKRTKIVATISDLKCDVDFIRELFNNGMNVIRINTAHASLEGTRQIIANVRRVSDKIAILVDTKGPEIRTLPLPQPILVEYGHHIKMTGDPNLAQSGDFVGVSYRNFANDIPVGTKILVDDGEMELIVESKTSQYLDCMVMNRGKIAGKKSVNIPSIHIKLPSLSEKDKEFIRFSVEEKVDFIAHSFVRNREDVLAVQQILDDLGSNISIIAKIENEQGVENIEEILDVAYGVMVARGDLAIEISPEKLPVVQKRLVEIALNRRRPVIVATQMLHSMIENPRPTRAEVNDVANAIFDGTDAIMLSGETAYGKYPMESVKMMTSIAKEVESNTLTYRALLKPESDFNKKPLRLHDQVAAQLTKAMIEAAEKLDVRAIIADTTTGNTIRALAAYRGRHTIYAQCYDPEVGRKLSLSYGVHVDFMEVPTNHAQFIQLALNNLSHKETFNKYNLVAVISSNFGQAGGASYIEISTVKNLSGNK
jgi:pyruvate kinase